MNTRPPLPPSLNGIKWQDVGIIKIVTEPSLTFFPVGLEDNAGGVCGDHRHPEADGQAGAEAGLAESPRDAQ